MHTLKVDDDLVLEWMHANHADELYALIEANRAHLGRWLPWVADTHSTVDVYAFIETAVQQHRANNGFHAVIRHGGRVVGSIGHHTIHWAHRSTSLGYWLSEDAQGSGIMTRTCRACIDHSFGDLALRRVEIRCAGGNQRSRAIPQRLGFRMEGILPGAEQIGEARHDLVVYAMQADHWYALSATK